MDKIKNISRNGFIAVFTRKHAGKIVCFFLIISTLVVFWQVQEFDFINFDDPSYVTENRHVKNGLTSPGFVWAFTQFHSGNWHPVTWMSHMLDVQLFGLDPGWHHLVNVLFHIVNTLLLFYVLRNMTGCLWRSALVAALFALHPLHVESVAWISERKDVLSTLFWLLTILIYNRYVKQPSTTKYLLMFAVLALGLMSKPMLVTLPFVLLLLDFWPLSRPGSHFLSAGLNVISIKMAWPLLREKIPLFALTALSCGMTFYAQKHGGAVIPLEALDAGARVGNAIYSYFMYIVKMFMPVKLAVFYPHPKTVALFSIIALAVMLGCIFYLVFRLRTKFPYLFVGWLWYVGTMVPVIGLIQVGDQAMADRYTYIPFIGLFIMLSWGAADLLRKFPKGKVWAAVSMIILIPAMMAVTWTQAGYWKNSVTLFERALAVTNENSLTLNNLGVAFEKSGQTQKALEHYQKALEINPDFEVAHNNLGLVLENIGSRKIAIEHFQKAILINSDFSDAHHNLGVTLLRDGQIEMAKTHMQRAVELENAHE